MTAPTEPARVTAGDTITWLKSLTDYPASAGWALAYTLVNAQGKYTVGTTASGDDHQASVSAAASALWVAGTYTWVAAVTRGAERYTVGQGSIVIAPDLIAAASHDGRTSARKALDSVNAALETYGAKAYLQSYEISGRKQAFHSPGEFLAYRSQLVAEVARETRAQRLAAGLSPRNQIHVRFGRP